MTIIQATNFSQIRLSSMDKYYQIGIDKNLLDITFASQENTMYCWAACIANTLRLKNIIVDQLDFAVQNCGVDTYGNPLNCGATPNEINYFLNGCGRDNNGIKYCINAKQRTGNLNTEEVVKQLKAGNSVIVAYLIPGQQTGHVVLITGASIRIDWRTQKEYVSQWIVRDPWPSPFNRLTKGRRTIQISELFKTAYAWWTPKISVTQPVQIHGNRVYPARTRVL